VPRHLFAYCVNRQSVFRAGISHGRQRRGDYRALPNAKFRNHNLKSGSPCRLRRPRWESQDWETDKKGRPALATTTEHPAERLGHSLEKAFKGRAVMISHMRTSRRTFTGGGIDPACLLRSIT
jgi:hypothetical protein